MGLFELCEESIGYDGHEVLREISLRIDQGERVALVGKSGAGKSTLLQLFYRQQHAKTAIIPQDLGLVKLLSVFHNVYMARLHRHRTWYNLLNLMRPQRREVAAVRALVEQLQMGEDKLYAPVGKLSGGQQQRTAVARAIHQGEKILMADEPVSSVDEHQSRLVLEAINAAHDTVLLAMHDVDLALAYTDRVVGLKQGRIVMDQPTAELEATDLDCLYQN